MNTEEKNFTLNINQFNLSIEFHFKVKLFSDYSAIYTVDQPDDRNSVSFEIIHDNSSGKNKVLQLI